MSKYLDYKITDQDLTDAKRIVDAATSASASAVGGTSPIVMVIACGFLLESARWLANSTPAEADEILSRLLKRARDAMGN
jgi:hypothetical protein